MNNNGTYLLQALNAIEVATGYVVGVGFTDFENNQMMQDAVIRQLEILGESVRRLDESFIEKHRDLPFLQAISIRNKLIHEYDDIDLEVLWETVKNDLPVFRIQIHKLLSSI